MRNLKAIIKEKVLDNDAAPPKSGLLKKKPAFPAKEYEARPASNLFKRLTGK